MENNSDILPDIFSPQPENAGGSGITSVVAGGFINIDDTDPNNPIISADVDDASTASDKLLSAQEIDTRIAAAPGYEFGLVTYTTSTPLTNEPRFTRSTPTPVQIDGTLSPTNGAWYSGADFSAGGTVNNLSLTNVVGIPGNLASGITFEGALSLPELTYVAQLLLSGTNNVTSISIPKLKYVNVASLVSYNLLSSATFSVLEAIIGAGSTTSFTSCPVLTSISFPNLKYAFTNFSAVSGTGNLTTFSLGSNLVYFGSINFTSCSLNQASVDGILAALLALDGTGNKMLYGAGRTITLTGTSSAPSAAGLLTKAALVLRGAIVTTN